MNLNSEPWFDNDVTSTMQEQKKISSGLVIRYNQSSYITPIENDIYERNLTLKQMQIQIKKYRKTLENFEVTWSKFQQTKKIKNFSNESSTIHFKV